MTTEEREQAIRDLILAIDALGRDSFAFIIERGCQLLSLDDHQAAKLFDTSVPILRMWVTGVCVPPVRPLVLKFLNDALMEALELEQRRTRRKNWHVCKHCGTERTVRIDQYDALACRACNVWLEARCSMGDQCDAGYCNGRPETPESCDWDDTNNTVYGGSDAV